MEKKVSFYRYFGDEGEVVKLSEVLEAIKIGAYKSPIEELRKLPKDEYDKQKKRLCHFTPSGTFVGNRNNESLVEYSQVIVLDIDHIDEEAPNVRNQVAKIEYTLAAFISPSGKGVKIIVNTDANANKHQYAYNQIVEYYKKELGVEIDTIGKDVSRTCFVSWDPEMYINENAKAFNIWSITGIPKFKDVSVTTEPDNYQYIVDYTDKVCNYFSGNRNNYVYILANNFNRVGISQFEAESFIKANYSGIEDEIPRTVKSAYSHTSEHGSLTLNYIYSASSERSASTAPLTVVKTPLIPEEIHNTLPELIKNGVDAMVLSREKDIFLTGVLSIFSGCFPNVYGLYDHKEVYANLNCLIISPPTGGKGNVNYARALAIPIHKYKREVYEINQSFQDEDDKKKFAVSLFIPADSSSAAVKESLSLNQGVGIICESEADTLSSTFKQDWGGYSELLRKAFHHEPILYSRIGKDEPIKFREIPNPKISVCLTGTPNQVSNLLKSSEDGLFSRFMYYTFKNEGVPFFKDVFSNKGIENKTEYFESLSERVFENYKQIIVKPSICFKLTENQHQIFLTHFNKMMKEVYWEFGEETDNLGTVKRLGLIAFRIAMVLSIIRNFDNKEFPNELICCEVDFENSIKLSDIYLKHAQAVYKTFPESTNIKQNAKKLYEFLPDKFEAKEALKIGTMICGYAERTVSNYLSDLKSIGWLKQPKINSTYYKQDMQ